MRQSKKTFKRTVIRGAAIVFLGYGGATSAQPSQAARQIASWEEARTLLRARQPDLQRQAAAVSQAQADVDRALAQMLPQLEVSAGMNYTVVNPTITVDELDQAVITHQVLQERNFIPGATASAVLTFSIANWVALRSAGAGESSARKALAATRHELLGSMAATLLGVVAAERIAERNRAGLKAAQDRFAMSERLVALGRADQLDTFRFAQDLYEAQGNVVSAEESLWQAREGLGNALGLGEPVGVAEAFDPTAILGPPRVSGCTPLPRLRARADFQAARQRARQADLAVDAARLSYLPEIQVGTSYGASYAPTALQSVAEFDSQRELLHTWSVSANLVWTAFDGGQRAASVASGLADLRAARAEQRAVQIAAQTEVRRSRRLLKVARANAAVAGRALKAATEADRLSRRAFELGKITALEGVEAARQLRTAAITLALRDVEVIGAKVRASMAQAQCH